MHECAIGVLIAHKQPAPQGGGIQILAPLQGETARKLCARTREIDNFSNALGLPSGGILFASMREPAAARRHCAAFVLLLGAPADPDPPNNW